MVTNSMITSTCCSSSSSLSSCISFAGPQPSSSASVGEVAACLVRVPTGVITQRMQVGQYASYQQAVRAIYAEDELAAARRAAPVAEHVRAATPQGEAAQGGKKRGGVNARQGTAQRRRRRAASRAAAEQTAGTD